tara:strand:+ start:1207 stop:1470 length:264 start_codon:yes stop_codon:yes gene_type:complete
MSHHINKTDTDRWFCIETEENIIHVFGQVNLGNILDTGEHILITYLTEDELETYVDSILGPNYYLIAVTTQNEIFMGASGKYPIPPI